MNAIRKARRLRIAIWGGVAALALVVLGLTVTVYNHNLALLLQASREGDRMALFMEQATREADAGVEVRRPGVEAAADGAR